jgi:CheY-like chemotaxis protein
MEMVIKDDRARTALVVEDDVNVRAVLAAMLALEGLGVIVAGDGAEGLARAEHDQPDLIVTDVAMPCMDGLTMVRRVRESLGRQVPTVVVSGHAELDLPADLCGERVRFMSKPLVLDDFRDLVRGLLSPPAAV